MPVISSHCRAQSFLKSMQIVLYYPVDRCRGYRGSGWFVSYVGSLRFCIGPPAALQPTSLALRLVFTGTKLESRAISRTLRWRWSRQVDEGAGPDRAFLPNVPRSQSGPSPVVSRRSRDDRLYHTISNRVFICGRTRMRTADGSAYGCCELTEKYKKCGSPEVTTQACGTGTLCLL